MCTQFKNHTHFRVKKLRTKLLKVESVFVSPMKATNSSLLVGFAKDDLNYDGDPNTPFLTVVNYTTVVISAAGLVAR